MIRKFRLWAVILFIICIGLDLYSKHYFTQLLEFEGNSIPVFQTDSISMYWTLLHNYGVSFSMFNEYPLFVKTVITCLSFIIGFVAIWICFQDGKFNNLMGKFYYFTGILIGSGSLGNGIDRLFSGYVTDFIHFRFWGYNFAVFNVADIFLTLGVLLFICTYFIKPEEESVTALYDEEDPKSKK